MRKQSLSPCQLPTASRILMPCAAVCLCAGLSDSLQSYQAAAKKSPSMPAAAEPEVGSWARCSGCCMVALNCTCQQTNAAHRNPVQQLCVSLLLLCLMRVCMLFPQAPSAPAFGGFSWGKPAAEPEQKAAPAPAAAPAKKESSSSDMGSMFSSDMWNTPIKVRPPLLAACQ